MNSIDRLAKDYLFANSRVIALQLDANLKILQANTGCTAILGYPIEELIGRRIYELLVVDPDVSLEAMFGAPHFEGEIIKFRAAFDHEITIFASFFRSDNAALFVGELVQNGVRQHTDITLELHKKTFVLAKSGEELQRRNAYLELANQRIRESLVTDPTTNLYKRNHLDRLLRAEWERTKRHNSNLCFFLISVDGLKALRELRGVEAATVITRGVARVLENRKRIFDVLGHFDADSFFLLLPHTPIDGARELAGRLSTLLENREIRVGDYPFHIFLSIGISVYNRHLYPAKGHEDLVHMAMEALLRAQLSGGNQVQVYEPQLASLRVVP